MLLAEVNQRYNSAVDRTRGKLVSLVFYPQLADLFLRTKQQIEKMATEELPIAAEVLIANELDECVSELEKAVDNYGLILCN